jgi:hypothetical protein
LGLGQPRVSVILRPALQVKILEFNQLTPEFNQLTPEFIQLNPEFHLDPEFNQLNPEFHRRFNSSTLFFGCRSRHINGNSRHY